jgi:hypothetical protein
MTRLLRRRTARRYPGLYRAIVVDATDPQGSSRLKVSVPSVSGAPLAWAPTLQHLGAGPQVGEEVLVGFEAGALDAPYVVGVLATGPSSAVEIADGNGNSIRLTSSGIDITGSAEVRLTTSTIKVTAGSANVDAGMSKFSGVVKASTVIADSVIAASYSPGAGNIW